MMTRRNCVQVATALTGCATGVGASALQWKHSPAGETDFFGSPVLLSGTKDEILLDRGFTLSDCKALAEAIKGDDEKKLAARGPLAQGLRCICPWR